MTATLAFTVPGAPLPWRRAGSHGGRRYTPTVVSDRQRLVATLAVLALRRAGLEPFTGPVALEVVAVYPRPKVRPDCVSREAWATGARLWRPVDSDVDNLAKLVADALQPRKVGSAGSKRPPLVYGDDAQVVDLRGRKVYAAVGEAPCTLVWLGPPGEAPQLRSVS